MSLLIGEKAFKLLHSTSSQTPIPALGLAAQAALTVIESALVSQYPIFCFGPRYLLYIYQVARRNKDECIALGKECCLVMTAIIQLSLGISEEADFVKQQQNVDEVFRSVVSTWIA